MPQTESNNDQLAISIFLKEQILGAFIQVKISGWLLNFMDSFAAINSTNGGRREPEEKLGRRNCRALE